MKPLLEIKELSVEFHTKSGDVKAVRKASLTLEAGQVLTILGESGSGKTALCKSVMGILPKNGFIQQGELYYKGERLDTTSEKVMREFRGKEIAMIFQDPMTALNPTLSIGRQIMEAVVLHQKITKRQAKLKVLELMSMVGIDNPESRFDQYPHQFSGGMKQRSVIAIALAGNPSVIIADEPTTALDVTIQKQILNLLKTLQAQTGVAIVLITHDLGVVAHMADRVAVMYAGRVVEMGTTEDIFYDPRHPYTWGLMSALPMMNEKDTYLQCIAGMPPNPAQLPKGDAFAPRNPYALKMDYVEEPPMFQISETHYAATWLLHEDAPHIKAPVQLKKAGA
jgi:oligopeptide transport system ATP-binding protein